MVTPLRDSAASAENRLLAALPKAEHDRLVPYMTGVTFGRGEVVYQSGAPIDAVYFPDAGVFSVVVAMENGAVVEVGTVGREGLLGVPAVLGADRAPVRVFCQVPPGRARRLPVRVFRERAREGGQLPTLAGRYAQAFLNQVSQTAACNRLHRVDRRLARCLLMAHDRAGTDVLPLTQEFLAQMLGVRRASVTEAALSLQRGGLIGYGRGRVTVLDRDGLEAAACECYRTVRDEFDGLLARPARRGE